MTQHSCDDNFVDDDFQSMTLREAVIHVSGHPEGSSRSVIPPDPSKKLDFLSD
jgi:hypothetical protein